MAEMLGGRFRHMEPDYLKPTVGVHVSSRSNTTNLLAFWDGAIIVNKRGERFVNESLENRSLGTATLSQPDQIVFEIFDQQVFDRMQSGEGRRAGEGAVKRMIKAETIAILATKIGIPIETLRKTIDRYNDGVDKGRDPDFGRTHLTQAGGTMTAVSTAPFYAFETSPWMPGTYGGIAVDEEMHVINDAGIIPGLYAAGEIVGGFHGAGYHIGSALTKALVFGRIAGRNCAAGR
jgi:fumarate reductase flavoprotein subunit